MISKQKIYNVFKTLGYCKRNLYLSLFLSRVETFHKQILSQQTEQNNDCPDDRLELTFSLLGMALKINSSLEKGLKLKVRRFSGLIPTFG